MTAYPSLIFSQQTLLGEWGGIRYWQALWRGSGECREVFVKELASGDEEVQRRFEQEGQVASRLKHEGITCLCASSAHQLAFQWLRGNSLRQRLEVQRQLPLDEALQMLRELLSALEYLHGQGVVHHDLKPENIMLPFGWPQVNRPVVLVDLGMAYDHQQLRDIHAGMRMGTPQFMPPEQFRGIRGDPRSDLYAAGAVLFDTLVGQPPFPNALGWLAGFDLTRLPLPQPPALAALLEAALQRDPEQRVQSATQMLALLEGVTI